LAASIYNTAAVSRTVSVLKSRLVASSSSQTCNNRGKFNSEKNVCDCVFGFFKKDCSLDKETFDNLVAMNDALVHSIDESWKQRNVLD